jgi:chorismate mutase/prephenate dehydratase
MSDLDNLRLQINEIDNHILDLIEKRMSISVKVGEYKKKNNMQVFDSKREKDLITRLSGYNSIDEELIKEIWNSIMNYSKKLQF